MGFLFGNLVCSFPAERKKSCFTKKAILTGGRFMNFSKPKKEKRPPAFILI
jgi:hypothetical protein